MKFLLSAVLSAALVLGTFQSANAASCSGKVGPVTLNENDGTNNLHVMWTAPPGESGCTYTINFASNAPNAVPQTFTTDDLSYVIDHGLLVPCSMATVSVSTSDGEAVTAETEVSTRTSTEPILLDMTTSCNSIQMIWEGQPYEENMCEHTHFQLFCLSDSHNFTIPQTVTDESNRIFNILIANLQADIFYTCNGYMFVTLAGFSPPSADIQFWSNLDSVRALAVAETESAITATWEPPLNSEQCGVAYHVTYENEVLGTNSVETVDPFVELDAEIIPCTDYKISVTPISSTGSHGTIVSVDYTPAVVHGTVSGVEVADNGDSLTVSWTPVNVGKCDVKFLVEYYVDDEIRVTEEIVGSSMDLERIPCSNSKVEVSVVNNGEVGIPVTVEMNLSSGDIQEISEVQNLQVSGSVVTWDAPVTVGKCGVMYEVTHDSPFGSTSNVIDTNEETLTLVPCSENTVTVRGVAGTLVGSDAAVEFVADSKDLEAPENLRVVPDFTVATLTMRAETKDVNSCPITQAEVSCDKEGGTSPYEATINVSDNDERVFEFDVTDLEEDSIYNCNVKWSNSDTRSDIRFRTIPIPRKQLSVTDVTTNGFTVVWSEDYGAEFVRGYELVVNSNGPAHEAKEGCGHETSNTFTFELEAGSENQVFVEGFPNYDYDMVLTTTYNLGSLGVTDGSEGLDTQTLIDLPGAPEDLQVDFEYEAGAAYDVTGVITWKAPCQLNGALRSFGVKVTATFDLGGSEQSMEYDLEVEANSPNDVFTYKLEKINPFFKYVVSVNTLAALTGPSDEIVITPPDICSCTSAI